METEERNIEQIKQESIKELLEKGKQLAFDTPKQALSHDLISRVYGSPAAEFLKN